MDILPLLEDLGIERLRAGDREIQGICPMHERRTGKADRHPSWSINRNTGAHICFSCGYKGGLVTLYTDLKGFVPENLMEEMLDSGLARDLAQPDEDDDEVEPDWVWEDELAESVPIPSTLLKIRRLKAESVAYYDVRWSTRYKAWMLPFTYPNGQVYGAQYRTKLGGERNRPTFAEKSLSLFGLDKVIRDSFNKPTLFVVESPLDAVRLGQVGATAVATYGAIISDEQIKLLDTYGCLIVDALDNDDAGEQGGERLRRKLSTPVTRFRYPEGIKDPGEFLTDDELWHATMESRCLI